MGERIFDFFLVDFQLGDTFFNGYVCIKELNVKTIFLDVRTNCA